MYILTQKLEKIFDKKILLSSFRQYALFFSFIYFISVIILLYYIPSDNLKTEPNYNDGIIISNQNLQQISRTIPLYTINISNNTVIGSIRISSSKEENNKFELSGFLYFTYNKSNIYNMKYILVSGESCHNWNNITQDISNKVIFKSRHQGTKIFKKIREISFESNKIESASHFVIIQNFRRNYRQIACNSLNNASKTNTF
ncbi:hypothetical protein RhiirA1_532332 [Rhizophagus irregularis]|uniref:Uncharacterized protein n=1 Tax=Rhizophagus irregularis TaxID=588596 RepID=A0A2I1DWB8_9GLOM|nr:hypothetical protein RhiirA1_532332 [Rhizophagus irregularis]PKY14163.1 hypothetical protein RhiirB3_426108 [Rhizophagus irregularis]CAB4473255.1 unnamed protein product [Rhizophagus irregularis]CAB5153842.1 unnamed protein product [Rhizophagus irregularis]CAB5339620.1 unnamed protein product [Rhizophagus irregularis]